MFWLTIGVVRHEDIEHRLTVTQEDLYGRAEERSVSRNAMHRQPVTGTVRPDKHIHRCHLGRAGSIAARRTTFGHPGGARQIIPRKDKALNGLTR